ncbi:DUF5689 domain-containing protein [Altibacter sp.]|uniref:DUF5689 domain-containing protein n=1 Tax=Altibacter sp. TaxID=2024823 RepID=UPI000C981497|nr:DUF5689 domain-containing protein [Altibacter sp.]MAP54252.1 hypothetical protein [Altibacter sp.]
MKTANFYKLFTLILALVVVVSCVKDDEFDVPSQEIEPVTIDQTKVIDIATLRDLLEQEINSNGNNILTFNENNPDNDKYIVGYVISSDEAGNFFEELVLQNDFQNPNAGVKVLADVNPLFTTYEFGRKVFVKLENLSVAFDSGVLALGVRDGNDVAKIAESNLFDVITRDPEVKEIVPLPLSINDFNAELTNLYIRLNDVQFNRNEVLGADPKTFAAEPDDQFDGERLLESCATGATVVFSTSTFADYKSLLLPTGRGTLDGLLTYNFFGDELNVTVNDPTSINFDSTERCDPMEVNCGLVSSVGSNVLFGDFFETQSTGSPISGNGWTNYIEAGTETWEAYFDDGTNASLGISARMGSFNSGDDASIGWLITPEVNFDAQDGETITFKTSNSFSDGSTLEVLFSSDWDGNPATITSATWSLLSDAYVVEDGEFFGDWFTSGNVDLSCITGSGYIAWKYTGSGEAAFDGTYELDEIEIRSN